MIAEIHDRGWALDRQSYTERQACVRCVQTMAGKHGRLRLSRAACQTAHRTDSDRIQRVVDAVKKPAALGRRGARAARMQIGSLAGCTCGPTSAGRSRDDAAGKSFLGKQAPAATTSTDTAIRDLQPACRSFTSLPLWPTSLLTDGL